MPAAQLTPPPDTVAQLVDQAFSNRPEIAAQGYEYQAAQRFQKAERDLLLPDIRVLGTVGRVPTGAPATGQLVRSDRRQRKHSHLQRLSLSRACAKKRHCVRRPNEERLRDLKDRIANDVRTSWLNSQTAYQPHLGHATVCRSDQPRGGSVADALQPGAGLDRGAEPGAAAADRGADSVRGGQVPVPHRGIGLALSDCGSVTLP